MKVYIAGPMTGQVGFNFDAFDHAARSLRAHGYAVYSPAEASIQAGFDPSAPDAVAIADKNYEKYMSNNFDAMKDCDEIFLLTGWENSNGAKRELAFAIALGLRVKQQK